MNAKKYFVIILIAVLLLPCLFSCGPEKDTHPTTPCLYHKDRDVNAVCDLCGESSLEPGEGVAYDDYTSLTADEQMAFIQSFGDMEDFLLWYDNEKTKFDEENKGTDIGGDGDIDIGDHINGN